MHWKTLIDDDAVYILGELDDQPVALKVTSCEHMAHEDLADLVAASLNLANSYISGNAAHLVNKVISAIKEGRTP